MPAAAHTCRTASSTAARPTKFGALMRMIVGSLAQGSRAGRPAEDAFDDPVAELGGRRSSATTRSCSAAMSSRRSACEPAMSSTFCSTVAVRSASVSTAVRTAPICEPKSECRLLMAARSAALSGAGASSGATFRRALSRERSGRSEDDPDTTVIVGADGMAAAGRAQQVG